MSVKITKKDDWVEGHILEEKLRHAIEECNASYLRGVAKVEASHGKKELAKKIEATALRLAEEYFRRGQTYQIDKRSD